MGVDYPWYEVVRPKTWANRPGSSNMEQGYFVDDCPVVLPSTTITEGAQQISGDVELYNVIIMSQSCDLQQRKIDLVLVCPVWSLSEFAQSNRRFGTPDGREALRKGQVVGYHLLNICNVDDFIREHLVVDLKNVYGVPYSYLEQLVTSRERILRLLPPYREHLAQAFARFFMRVGLPLDIEPFAKR